MILPDHIELVALDGDHGVGKTTVLRRAAEVLAASECSVRTLRHSPPPPGASAYTVAAHYATERGRMLDELHQVDAHRRDPNRRMVALVDRWVPCGYVRVRALVRVGLDGDPRMALRPEILAAYEMLDLEASLLPPVLLILLVAPPESLLARRRKRGEHLDEISAVERAEGEVWRYQVSAGCPAFQRIHKRALVQVDASGDVEEVVARVVSAINAHRRST